MNSESNATSSWTMSYVFVVEESPSSSLPIGFGPRLMFCWLSAGTMVPSIQTSLWLAVPLTMMCTCAVCQEPRGATVVLVVETAVMSFRRPILSVLVTNRVAIGVWPARFVAEAEQVDIGGGRLADDLEAGLVVEVRLGSGELLDRRGAAGTGRRSLGRIATGEHRLLLGLEAARRSSSWRSRPISKPSWKSTATVGVVAVASLLSVETISGRVGRADLVGVGRSRRDARVRVRRLRADRRQRLTVAEDLVAGHADVVVPRRSRLRSIFVL